MVPSNFLSLAMTGLAIRDGLAGFGMLCRGVEGLE